MAEIPKLAVAAGGGQLRAALLALPPFPLDRLLQQQQTIDPAVNAGQPAETQQEQQRQLWRAYMVLSFLSHAFLWCDGPETPQKLPAVLAAPWVAVAKALDMPPVLVYATYNLLNWRRLDPSKPIELGNIVCINNFLGGTDEEWFRLVHVAIEAAAAPAVAALEPLQRAAAAGDEGAMVRDLELVRAALQRMQQLLSRMVGA
jgi:hypothetical protein